MYRREAAARILYGITKQDISDENGTRVFYGTGDNHMFRVLKKIKDGKLVEEADVQTVINQVIREKIDMLIVDPLAETHNLDENNNVEMLQVMQIYRRIAQDANCAVMLIHHTRKKDKAATDGHSGNMDALRGASSVAALSRIVVTLDTMSKESAKRYLSNPEDRFKYVELAFAKANMSLAHGQLLFYERVSVNIGITDDDFDGEEVGALKYVEFAKVEKRLKKDDKDLLENIKNLCTDTPESLRSILEQLIKTNPFYADKKSNSYIKSVPNMFNGDGELLLESGTLFLTKTITDKRGSYLISYKENSIDDIL